MKLTWYDPFHCLIRSSAVASHVTTGSFWLKSHWAGHPMIQMTARQTTEFRRSSQLPLPLKHIESRILVCLRAKSGYLDLFGWMMHVFLHNIFHLRSTHGLSDGPWYPKQDHQVSSDAQPWCWPRLAGSAIDTPKSRGCWKFVEGVRDVLADWWMFVSFGFQFQYDIRLSRVHLVKAIWGCYLLLVIVVLCH